MIDLQHCPGIKAKTIIHFFNFVFILFIDSLGVLHHIPQFFSSHILLLSLLHPPKRNRGSKQIKIRKKNTKQKKTSLSFLKYIITKSYIFILYDFYLATVVIVELIYLVSICVLHYICRFPGSLYVQWFITQCKSFCIH